MPKAGSRSNGRNETATPVWSRKHWTGSGQLEVAIWSRMVGEGDQEREVFNTSIKKTYKADEEYKESSSFRAEELPLVAAALTEAWLWISEQTHRA